MTVTLARPPVARLDDLASLVHAEFQEMPGMHLTFAQAQRLWNLSTEDCKAVFDYLVAAGMVAQDGANRFCRFES